MRLVSIAAIVADVNPPDTWLSAVNSTAARRRVDPHRLSVPTACPARHGQRGSKHNNRNVFRPDMACAASNAGKGVPGRPERTPASWYGAGFIPCPPNIRIGHNILKMIGYKSSSMAVIQAEAGCAVFSRCPAEKPARPGPVRKGAASAIRLAGRRGPPYGQCQRRPGYEKDARNDERGV